MKPAEIIVCPAGETDSAAADSPDNRKADYSFNSVTHFSFLIRKCVQGWGKDGSYPLPGEIIAGLCKRVFVRVGVFVYVFV